MTVNYEPQHDYYNYKDYKAYQESRKDNDLLEEVRQLRRIVAALCAHLGVTGTHSPYR